MKLRLVCIYGVVNLFTMSNNLAAFTADRRDVDRPKFLQILRNQILFLYPAIFPPPLKDGGGERDRTDDLLNANQALSQLSYTPIFIQ